MPAKEIGRRVLADAAPAPRRKLLREATGKASLPDTSPMVLWLDVRGDLLAWDFAFLFSSFPKGPAKYVRFCPLPKSGHLFFSSE